ncbi:MAG TPA: hypothetical protein VGM03_04925 [Phycisphaerae bacterium]
MNPMTSDEARALTAKVQARLKEKRVSTGTALAVSEDDIRQENGWICVVIAPAARGIRAYD